MQKRKPQKVENQLYHLHCEQQDSERKRVKQQQTQDSAAAAPTAPDFHVTIEAKKQFKRCNLIVAFNKDVNVSMFDAMGVVEALISNEFKFKVDGNSITLNGNEFRMLFDVDFNNETEVNMVRVDLQPAIEAAIRKMLMPRPKAAPV
jgi:hypothetical protein